MTTSFYIWVTWYCSRGILIWNISRQVCSLIHSTDYVQQTCSVRVCSHKQFCDGQRKRLISTMHPRVLQAPVWVPPSKLQGSQNSGTNCMEIMASRKALSLVVVSSLGGNLVQGVKANAGEMEVPSLNIHRSRPGPTSLTNENYCIGPNFMRSNLMLDNCN